jgi:MSHA type pilus biogenesis protein MshL
MIEVKLNDSFRFGVDWSSLRKDIATAFTASSRVVSGVTGDFGDLSQGTRTITISGNSLSAGTDPSLSWNRVTEEGAVAVDMMQKYGDVAVLSNPTIRSKHGQAAIISVGTSSTYVSDTRVVTTGASGTAITSQEIQTSQVFDGLMVGVVPYIDADGNISMSVHPVQSRVDPMSLQLVDAGGDTKVTLPVVDLKTMVTQLKVRSGDSVILGGLIDQADSRADSEVPGLGRIPLVGNLFKKRNNQNSLRELVIVLKVTML